jgi:membrane fusion protein (multidrug efflux system)
MLVRVVLVCVAITLVFGGYYGYKRHTADRQAKLAAAMQPPPATVSSATVTTHEWQQALLTTGTLKAGKQVTLDAQTGGLLSDVLFQSGQQVKAGAVIAKLDDTPERAQLRSAQAALELAEVNLKRKMELQSKNMVAAADLDLVREQAESAQADVDRIKDLIEHKLLRTPFAGSLGLKNIEAGDFIAMGAPVVEVHAMQQMILRYFVPERYITQISVGMDVDFTLDTYPAETFKARVTATDVALTETNRSLEIEARVDNPDAKLLPGMFARVAIPVGKTTTSPAVPEAAVVFSLYGDSVFVVTRQEGKQTVSRREITIGQQQNGQIQVLKGVTAGEEVVVAGQNKLRDGMPIRVDNAVLPTRQPH